MTKTVEPETTTQEPVAAWASFDDDAALLQHILSKKPAEKLVDVPEWDTQLLCRALSAEARLEVDTRVYDKETKTSDYRKAFDLIIIHGCYNPKTGNRFFKREHASQLMKQVEGGPVANLALTVLRLSRMLADDAANAKKN